MNGHQGAPCCKLLVPPKAMQKGQFFFVYLVNNYLVMIVKGRPGHHEQGIRGREYLSSVYVCSIVKYSSLRTSTGRGTCNRCVLGSKKGILGMI